MKHKSAILLLCPSLLLAGCVARGTVAGGHRHLSAMQCRDLGASKTTAPASHERSMGELAALEQAGYRPGRSLEPNYPDELQAAQHTVDAWYMEDCTQSRPR